jgi:RnfABCDGE-type electron transport complex B subunit
MKEIVVSVLVLGLTGLGFSLLLAFLSKKLKVEEDPLVAQVLAALPGLNCGACGFSGCRAFAEAIIKEKQLFKGCLPGGNEINTTLSKILGIDNVVSTKTTAICRCGAQEGEKKASTRYQGISTCKAADIIGGAIDCLYGCLAFGDCISVCPTGAITLENKKIYVDPKKCISCAKCVTACPRKLFEIVPVKEEYGAYFVACNNKEKCKYVRDVCGRGCISCGICVRVNDSPFYLKDNLSYIDYSRIKGKQPLEEAKSKCPTKCILNVDV